MFQEKRNMENPRPPDESNIHFFIAESVSGGCGCDPWHSGGSGFQQEMDEHELAVAIAEAKEILN
jgi:hypothetical protein